MSEVDRLSNSGLYPALPIADKRGRNGSAGQNSPDKQPDKPAPKAGESSAQTPRPPKSIIDEYA
jgi:hypothetical protein